MPKYLEIAGEKKRGPEWTCLNVYDAPGCVKQDMTDLPIKSPDNNYDGVYSEHFIEHLYWYQGINFFNEMYRVMKPGGVMRHVWPSHELVELLVSDRDLPLHMMMFVENYYKIYIEKYQFAPPEYKTKSKREACALGLLHQGGEHRYLWGLEELIDTLENLGFVNVIASGYGKSKVPFLDNLEKNSQMRALHSSIIEATKPKESEDEKL